jgi:hypothetical protein
MENYKDSALRHYDDAQVLRSANKLDNAGHLIGFSAECAIKHAISTFNSNTEKPKGHFPDFVGVAKKHVDKRSAMFGLLQGDLLDGWRVERRYHSSGATTPAEVDSWFQHTRRLIGAAGIKGRT